LRHLPRLPNQKGYACSGANWTKPRGKSQKNKKGRGFGEGFIQNGTDRKGKSAIGLQRTGCVKQKLINRNPFQELRLARELGPKEDGPELNLRWGREKNY